MRKQADALKVCPIPDACLLVMTQRPSRLLGLPETRSLNFLIKNSPDQAEGYLDYLQPMFCKGICRMRWVGLMLIAILCLVTGYLPYQTCGEEHLAWGLPNDFFQGEQTDSYSDARVFHRPVDSPVLKCIGSSTGHCRFPLSLIWIVPDD
jgi:hypothetical protein